MITVTVPVRLVSETNAREPWQARHRRRKAIRGAVGLVVRNALRGAAPAQQWAITLTRISAGTLDVDNAWSSAKPAIDGIADALGLDDADPRITWQVQQRRGKRGEWAVEIHIVPGGQPCTA